MRALSERPTKSDPLIQAIEFYYDHPIEFVEDIIGVSPTTEQRRVLETLPTAHHIAVKSGHGIGKTALEAWVILWFMATRPDAKIPCTAPTAHQLDDILWPEVRLWLDRSTISKAFEWTMTRLAMRGSEKTWFAVPRSSNTPENMQGFHGSEIMFVIDEASGVDQEIMEVIEGALTNDGAKLMMLGNPTKTSGTFFDAFHKDRDLYQTFTFNAEESELVSQEYCDRIAKKYGRESDVYRVRVLGQFPKGEPDAFISLTEVEGAIGRELVPDGKWFIGVDPARYGDDESVIYYRRGYQVFDPLTFHGINTSRLTGEIARLVKTIIPELDEKEFVSIRVDDTGVGGGVTDQLQEITDLPIVIDPVNFGGAGDEDYADYTGVMWGAIKEILPELSLPDDDVLVSQLTTRKYRVQPDGKIKLERKDDMRKRGLPSPDRADALALSFAPTMGVGIAWV